MKRVMRAKSEKPAKGEAHFQGGSPEATHQWRRKTINYFQFTKCLSLILILNFFLLAFSIPKTANADTFSNGNYSIDVGNIDTNPQPTPYPQVLGTNNTNIIKPNYFTTGPNYLINASTTTFSFSLSQNAIDYGILSSTNPVIRNSQINLQDNFFGGEIFVYEDHPLTSTTKTVIQNTSCDNGVCTPEIAAPWTNTLTYGFGYRCDSNQSICDTQFLTPNYFKPFADISIDHTPETILFTRKGHSQATVTYKVNISGTQKTGGYYNSITYVAIPNF